MSNSNNDPLALIELAILENKPNEKLLALLIEENEAKLESMTNYLISFAFSQNVPPEHFRWAISTLMCSGDPENPMLGKLLRSSFLSKKMIKYSLDAIKNIDYQDCVIALSYGPDDSIAERLMHELDQIFGPQTYSIYERLISILQPPSYIAPTNIEISGFNRVVYSHILNKSKGISHYSKIPSWVLKITKPTPEDIPYDDPKSKAITLPNEEEAADLILNSILGDLKNKDDADSGDIALMRSTLVSAYASAVTDIQKLHILLPVYQILLERENEDIELFRYFGPSNPFINLTGTCNEVCTRMFCDTSYFDHDYDEIDMLGDDREIGPLEWYEGTCDKCNRKIRQYNHCFRMPKEGGGWLGCYCRAKCVKEDLMPPVDEESTAIYEIRSYLIDYFSRQLKRIGVYDINDDAT